MQPVFLIGQLMSEQPISSLQRDSTVLDATVSSILLLYGLPSKHNLCALTKAVMIESILRHEATREYKGNIDHDDWRSSREAELILLPLNGEQLSLRALVSQYHIRLASTGSSREQAVAAILCYE